MKKVFFLMVSLLILSVLLAGCKSQTVLSNETSVSEFTGTVRDASNNQALAGVHVALGNIAETDTTSNGVFTFTKQNNEEPIPPGTYTVTFTKDNYEPKVVAPCPLNGGKCALSEDVKMIPVKKD